MRLQLLFFICCFFAIHTSAQKDSNIHVFENEPVNFKGNSGTDKDVERRQNGRIIYKKIEVGEFIEGSDVSVRLALRSTGDRWDKSGSCFVVANPELISILDVANGSDEFPLESGIDSLFSGIKKTLTYEPAIELVRFVTPFGVGHFSKDNSSRRRPVYIPSWENEVVWQTDVSHLIDLVDNSFYIGIWIDTWTKEGYSVDLSLHYSNRPNTVPKVQPLFNTISYVKGQSLPEFFASQALQQGFYFDKPVKNVKLHYITTGHGGHSGGDEFSKKSNRLIVDNKIILDTVPWRNDCASFRRYNPSSGVWLKKDSASYIDFKEKKYKVKEIEERIASSDLSRSNWCPGSSVEPLVVNLGDMVAGQHNLILEIDATPAGLKKYNHWLASAYLTYEQ